MQYFDPEVIPEEILVKAEVSDLLDIDIISYPGSLPLNCLENVKKYISKNGGEIQFCWIATVFGNIALKLTAHAVVKRKDNSLLCITLDKSRVDRVKFYADGSLSSKIRNNFLPSRFIPFIEDDNLNAFKILEDKANNIRMNSGCIFVDAITETSDIDREKSDIYPALLELAKANTRSNDLCYCGSGRIRILCHGHG